MHVVLLFINELCGGALIVSTVEFPALTSCVVVRDSVNSSRPVTSRQLLFHLTAHLLFSRLVSRFVFDVAHLHSSVWDIVFPRSPDTWLTSSLLCHPVCFPAASCSSSSSPRPICSSQRGKIRRSNSGMPTNSSTSRRWR